MFQIGVCVTAYLFFDVKNMVNVEVVCYNVTYRFSKNILIDNQDKVSISNFTRRGELWKNKNIWYQ